LKNSERLRIRPTPYGWILIFLLVWIPVTAIGSANNFLFIVFIMLLGLALVSHWLAKKNLNSVELSRRLPDEIFAGGSFTVQYLLKSNLSPWGATTLMWSEAFPLEGTTAAVPFYRVPVDELTVETSHFSISSRGDKEINPGSLSSAFPFGLARYSRKTGGNRSVLVFPMIQPIQGDIPFDLGESRKGLERPDPSGTIPYHYREYASGDPYKHIDWKQTSKTGSLITRTFSEQGSREVVIRLARHASEHAISKAASLVVHFAGMGVPIAFQGPGIAIEAGTGKEFTRKILTMLARWDRTSEVASRDHHSLGTVVTIDAAGSLAWNKPGETDGPEALDIGLG
jgi:uncharacterized protein (DUF58 family)